MATTQLNIAKIVLGIGLCVALCSGSYILGQNAQTDDDFKAEITSADEELRGFGDATPENAAKVAAQIAQRAAGDAALTQTVVEQAFWSQRTKRDEFNDLKLRSLEIAQNQRIIELLEQIKANKKGE